MDPYLQQRKTALQEFAKTYGLRKDWHEPDEQDVTAVVTGCHLDNAKGEHQAGMEPQYHELVVHLAVNGSYKLSVNLATLLAIAAK